MAMRVLYLDVDDEITSAAARIRSAEEIRVAVVLPYGSRVATSRINFRLLARDATVNGKRLSIIAGDAATRALAASAGLPIFATVAEYESSLEAEKAQKAEVGETDGAGAAAAVIAETPSETPAPPAKASRRATRRKASKPATEETGTATAVSTPAMPWAEAPDVSPGSAVPPAAAIGAASAAAAATASTAPTAPTPPAAPATTAADTSAAERSAAPPVPARSSSPFQPPAFTVPEPRPTSRAPSVVPAERVIADTPSRPAILERSFGPLATRMPIIIGAAVLALALLVGGVGAYLLLPTATVVVTPREGSIGPIELRITASPSASEPDQAAKSVPAVTHDLQVEASQTFEVTGKRVEETKATGTVRFRNKDFTSSNTIPRGSVVSTQSGIRFRTDRAITVPRAELVGLQIFPSSASVKVTAVNAGPDGNVEPNTILVIPRGEDPLTLDVTNPNATKGGKRDEFPRVAQADIDKAMTALGAELTAKFQEQLADPALAGDGTTVFPETASLGEPSYAVQPATLVGDEVPSFELGATATGTVLAVDEAAVLAVATADIATHVEPGYALVDGSSEVTPSAGVVEDDVIAFPVVITARQVLNLDTAAIENEIRGKSLAEAQTILQRYGTAELSVWPDWVGSIPTLDARVEVRSAAADSGTSP
jgi:hypothetical protein